MQLLCLVFQADNSGIAPNDIIDSVINKKGKIQRCVQEVRSNFRNILSTKAGQETIVLVNMFMERRLKDESMGTRHNPN